MADLSYMDEIEKKAQEAADAAVANPDIPLAQTMDPVNYADQRAKQAQEQVARGADLATATGVPVPPQAQAPNPYIGQQMPTAPAQQQVVPEQHPPVAVNVNTAPQPQQAQEAPRPAMPVPPSAREEIHKRIAEQEDIKEGFKAGIALRQEAALTGAAKGEEIANMQAERFARAAQISQDSQQKELKRQQKIQGAMDTEISKFQAMQKDVADGKIDPERLWHSKTTGEKTRAIISIILGGIGGAITHQSNVGLDLLNAEIARDIEAQKEALRSKEKGLGAQNTLIGLTRERFQDESASDARAHALALEGVQMQVNGLGAQARSQEMKAKAADLVGQLETSKQEWLQRANGADLSRLQQQAMMEQRQEILNVAKMGGLKNADVLDPADRERAVRMPDGTIRLADSKERAKDVTSFANEVVPGIEGAKRILKIADQGSKFSPEDRAKIATEMTALIGQLRLPFTGPGVLTNTEYDRLKDNIGDPTRLFSLPQLERKKLEVVINKLQSDLHGRYQRAGIDSRDLRDPNEKNIEILMNRNKGLTRDQAVQALRKTGRLIE